MPRFAWNGCYSVGAVIAVFPVITSTVEEMDVIPLDASNNVVLLTAGLTSGTGTTGSFDSSRLLLSNGVW